MHCVCALKIDVFLHVKNVSFAYLNVENLHSDLSLWVSLYVSPLLPPPSPLMHQANPLLIPIVFALSPFESRNDFRKYFSSFKISELFTKNVSISRGEKQG